MSRSEEGASRPLPDGLLAELADLLRRHPGELVRLRAELPGGVRCVLSLLPGQAAPARLTPRYDRARRELWLGDVLLHRYRRPAPHQQTLLSALEEDGWPDAIDDPCDPGTLRQTLDNMAAWLAGTPLVIYSEGSREARVCWRLRAEG